MLSDAVLEELDDAVKAGVDLLASVVLCRVSVLCRERTVSHLLSVRIYPMPFLIREAPLRFAFRSVSR